jgi:hypothetical protein
MFFVMFLISVQSATVQPRPMQAFERDDRTGLDREGFTCGPMRDNAVGGRVRVCETIK